MKALTNSSDERKRAADHCIELLLTITAFELLDKNIANPIQVFKVFKGIISWMHSINDRDVDYQEAKEALHDDYKLTISTDCNKLRIKCDWEEKQIGREEMMSNFGKNLKMRRTNLGMKQTELGEIANVTDESISSYECGNRLPSLYVAIALADALGCTVDDLLRGAKYNG